MKCPQCHFEIENHPVCPQCGAAFEQKPRPAWEWRDNKPPGPQTIAAGETWRFRLPLIGDAAPPRCQWTGLPGKAPDEAVYTDDLTIEVDIPEDMSGMHKIFYALAGCEPLKGYLLLKIIPKQKPAETPKPGMPKNPDAAEMAASKPSESPAIKATHVSNVETTPTFSETDGQQPAQTESSDTIRPTGTASFETATAPNSAPRIIDAYSDSVYVQVFRGNIPITQLKTKLQHHQSLLVGKRSESKNIFPQIDLKSHFPDSQTESYCSREQAKVYWSEGHVFIRNLGVSPLRVKNNRAIEKGEDYDWPLDDPVELPGGLILRLILEAAG